MREAQVHIVKTANVTIAQRKLDASLEEQLRALSASMAGIESMEVKDCINANLISVPRLQQWIELHTKMSDILGRTSPSFKSQNEEVLNQLAAKQQICAKCLTDSSKKVFEGLVKPFMDEFLAFLDGSLVHDDPAQHLSEMLIKSSDGCFLDAALLARFLPACELQKVQSTRETLNTSLGNLMDVLPLTVSSHMGQDLQSLPAVKHSRSVSLIDPSIDLPKVLPSVVRIKLETLDDAMTECDKVQAFLLAGHIEIDSFNQAPDHDVVTSINESSLKVLPSKQKKTTAADPRLASGRNGPGSSVSRDSCLRSPTTLPGCTRRGRR